MRSLINIRQDIHLALEKLHSLKTKQACIKLRDGKLSDLRREASDAVHTLFNSGDTITLNHSVNCTTPSGGGWGCEGTVRVIDAIGTMLVVDCGGTVMYIEIVEDWKCWGQNSFYAFESALLERGQDISRACLEFELSTARKHLKGALSARNSKSVVDGKRLIESPHFQERILSMINNIRGYSIALSGVTQ